MLWIIKKEFYLSTVTENLDSSSASTLTSKKIQDHWQELPIRQRALYPPALERKWQSSESWPIRYPQKVWTGCLKFPGIPKMIELGALA